MKRFIEYVKKELEKIEERYLEEREDILSSEDIEDIEMCLDQTETDYYNQIRYLMNICYSRCLPEEIIEEIFDSFF